MLPLNLQMHPVFNLAELCLRTIKDDKKNYDMIRNYYADCAVHTEDALEFFNVQVLLHLLTAERHLDKRPLSFSLSVYLPQYVLPNCLCSRRNSGVA